MNLHRGHRRLLVPAIVTALAATSVGVWFWLRGDGPVSTQIEVTVYVRGCVDVTCVKLLLPDVQVTAEQDGEKVAHGTTDQQGHVVLEMPASGGDFTIVGRSVAISDGGFAAPVHVDSGKATSLTEIRELNPAFKSIN